MEGKMDGGGSDPDNGMDGRKEWTEGMDGMDGWMDGMDGRAILKYKLG